MSLGYVTSVTSCARDCQLSPTRCYRERVYRGVHTTAGGAHALLHRLRACVVAGRTDDVTGAGRSNSKYMKFTCRNTCARFHYSLEKRTSTVCMRTFGPMPSDSLVYVHVHVYTFLMNVLIVYKRCLYM